ncbi:MAG: molybdenum cofactor guanylyltransferase [Candidatus Lokiarchaeota archaeon]|nr:molybdenum cofactor guanylyltransferase [Candidatus Lokiarchaeota archaeon]
MNEDPKFLAIIILIGGKSVRFGTETGLIDFNGKPVIYHQVETLSKFDENLYLVAHSDIQINKYRNISFPRKVEYIIDDKELLSDDDFRSPMLGIYSGLKKLNELHFENVLLMSGDAPLIKEKVIELLINQLEGYECCIPKWKNEFLEPLFAIYPVSKAYENAKNSMITKNFSLSGILDDEWNINYISVENSIKPLDENLVSLININGPVDIEKLKELY